MHETKEKVKKLSEMKEKLVCCMEAQFSKGMECVDTEEAGKVVDMIKDLAEAEEKCWKACYYHKIVEAMEEAKEEEENGSEMPWYLRMFNPKAGYDNWRYSSGRFAPKGHGHRSGYVMPYEMDSMMSDEYMDWQNPRMGYDSRGGGSMQSRGTRSGNVSRSGYGQNYDRYQDARRHYHESGSMEDKREMSDSAKGHITESMETMREIWKEADPELQKKMKSDLTHLINEMQ